ncbi:MAG: LytTR family transcriptional regulator [Bacteroidaceae bacterium]|nr:LytTR family transcriptional regulator [Bacteroidaceae bacterium]
MNQGQKDIIRIRVISAAFTALALAVFKPFGLDAWQWLAFIHLTIIFVLGIMTCMLTDAVMKHILKIPVSIDDSRTDINDFIRHNLYFQIINTLLVALMICLYRHFMMSDLIPANHLSWNNFFETLVIIAFCSFAIGLYWRFKFRSRYLAAELEETRLLNEHLKELRQNEERRAEEPQSAITETTGATASPFVVLTGTTNETIKLQVADLLYLETVGNYVKVHYWCDNQVKTSLLRATSKQMEDELQDYPMIVRCHRSFLVNLCQVEQIISRAGSMQLVICNCQEPVPVSRSNMTRIKESIKEMSGKA